MLNRLASAMSATAIFAAVLLAVILMPASAQVLAAGAASGAMGIRPMPAASGVRTPGMERSGAGFAGGPSSQHRGHSSGKSILLPYPYYYSDYGYESEAAQPQIVVVPAAAPAQPAPPAPPLEPLLIEWQGDHFERMTPSQKTASTDQSGLDAAKSAGSTAAPGAYSSGSLRPARKIVAQPARESARELPPAVLVFRDGRTEEVSDYTIMSGTIYSKADYWTTGSWTRKIQIADLDVPATLKLNRDHGLNFVLPASPNEVVTRP